MTSTVGDRDEVATALLMLKIQGIGLPQSEANSWLESCKFEVGDKIQLLPTFSPEG